MFVKSEIQSFSQSFFLSLVFRVGQDRASVKSRKSKVPTSFVRS